MPRDRYLHAGDTFAADTGPKDRKRLVTAAKPGRITLILPALCEACKDLMATVTVFGEDIATATNWIAPGGSSAFKGFDGITGTPGKN